MHLKELDNEYLLLKVKAEARESEKKLCFYVAKAGLKFQFLLI